MNKTEKVFDQSVESAVAAAAGSINYKQKFEGFDAAIEQMNERTKFDPSLSQFVKGTVLDFDPEKMKYGISDIGNNGASVISVPAGTRGADDKVTFNRAMNIYLSSLDKVIRVTDANGEPVLKTDGSNAPEIIDGGDNAVYAALSACKSDGAKLAWLKGKTLEIIEVKRGYGPSNYVQIGESRVPKGHRLTSLPLFKEL